MVYEGSHSPCPLQHLLLFVFFKSSTDQGKMKSLSTFYLLASFHRTRRYCGCDQMGKVMNEESYPTVNNVRYSHYHYGKICP